MQLTKNFTLQEFASRGTPVPTHFVPHVMTVATNLQKLRDLIGLPITITSGYRTYTHNSSVGGSPSSYHLAAQAADFVVDGIPHWAIGLLVRLLIATGTMKQGELRVYSRHIHYAPYGPMRFTLNATYNK